MADQPEEVLPRFVDLAMEMAGGVSAELSLYEETPAPGVFRWQYLLHRENIGEGAWPRHAGRSPPQFQKRLQREVLRTGAGSV